MSEGDILLDLGTDGTDDIEEWMYYTVMGHESGIGVLGSVRAWLRHISGSEHEKQPDIKVVDTIEKALNSVFTEVRTVPAYETYLAMWFEIYLLKDTYKEGEMSEEDYKKARSAAGNREAVRQNLIEVKLRMNLEDGQAASELLAALLGNPGAIYEYLVEPVDDDDFNDDKVEFERRCKQIGRDHNDRLRQLVPKALEVVKRLKEDESMRVRGILTGEKDDLVRAWLDAYSQLERNLKASQ